MNEVSSSPQKPRALIASLSPIHRDPRVLNQIAWLTQAGVEVDVVGTTPGPDMPGVRYFVVRQLPLFQRLISYMALSPGERFNKLVFRGTDESIWGRLSKGTYSHVVLNDLDFVPMLTRRNYKIAPRTHVHLDLHEFFPGTKGPLVWEFTQRKYLNWLIDESRRITTASNSTVSIELCREYENFYPMTSFNPVTNAPRVSESPYQLRKSETIALIYHGNSGRGRALIRILWAFRKLNTRFTLTYMLVCSPTKRLGFRFLAKVFGVSESFTVLEPVKTQEISATVSKFDMGIMVLPPISRNLEFAFPNKLFETLAGGAGVICGESKSIASLVRKGNLGVVVSGWNSRSIRDEISMLSRDQVEVFRQNASKSRIDLEWEKSRLTFLECLRLNS